VPPLEIVRPAYLHTPSSAVGTFGDMVRDFSASELGRAFDPEQELVVDAVMSYDEQGQHAAMVACIICARQNLKTYVMESMALWKLFVGMSPLVIWSAHEVSTALSSFKTFSGYCENVDSLRKRVKHVYTDPSNERIEMMDGRELKIRARTKSGARGLACPDLFLDEGWALKPTQLGAILPVMSAQEDPHVVIGSSAGLLDSESLRDLRDDGRAGDDDMAYAEFCAPGSFAEPGCEDPRCDHKYGTVKGCSLDRMDYVRMANPASRSGRIGKKYLRTERKKLPAAEYARERLGWWDEPLSSLPIPLNRFLTALDQLLVPVGRCVFALDVEVDRGSGVITAGWRGVDGLPCAANIDIRPGTSWMVPRLITHIAKHKPVAVIINDAGPVGSLAAGLAKANIEVTKMNGSDMAKACGDLYSKTVDEVEPQWRFKDPIPDGAKFGPIVAALRGSQKRRLGDAWAFDRRTSTVPIAPLVTVAEAIWGVEMIPAEPRVLVDWG
jgi:hypothetical protein